MSKGNIGARRCIVFATVLVPSRDSAGSEHFSECLERCRGASDLQQKNIKTVLTSGCAMGHVSTCLYNIL